MGHKDRGLTLLELLLVMGIVGIAMSFAIPSYRDHVLRVNRTDAKTALLQAAQALERCAANAPPFAYDSATCNAAVSFPITAPSGSYRVSAVRTATTYVLTAAPQNRQAADTECASFTLNESGLRAVTGSASATPAKCWLR